MAGGTLRAGSSREHAALAPMYLGIKSIARIHKANLVITVSFPFFLGTLRTGKADRQGDVLLLADEKSDPRRGKFLITTKPRVSN